MSILIVALIVLLVAGLLVWACDYLPLPSPVGGLVRFLIILIAAVFILNRAGIV